MHDFSNFHLEQYQFVKKLGGGAFGQVWLANELGPQYKFFREVAIKVFIADRHDSKANKEKFESFWTDVENLGAFSSDRPIVPYYNYLQRELAIGQTGTVRALENSQADQRDHVVPLSLLSWSMPTAGTWDQRIEAR